MKSDLDNTKAEAQFYELDERRSETLTWTPEEEKALVKKIDSYLLPCIWLMYLLSYMVTNPDPSYENLGD